MYVRSYGCIARVECIVQGAVNLGIQLYNSITREETKYSSNWAAGIFVSSEIADSLFGE